MKILAGINLIIATNNIINIGRNSYTDAWFIKIFHLLFVINVLFLLALLYVEINNTPVITDTPNNETKPTPLDTLKLYHETSEP